MKLRRFDLVVLSLEIISFVSVEKFQYGFSFLKIILHSIKPTYLQMMHFVIVIFQHQL